MGISEMKLYLAAIALFLVCSASAGKTKHMPTGQDIEDAWTKLVNPLSCEETCLKTCCRDGGGKDCISACGCKGKSCPPKADVNAFIKLMASWKPRANGGCPKP